MGFKDRMIEAVERGETTMENAYDYVREQMADAADRQRDTNAYVPPPVFIVGDRVVWDDGDEQGAFTGTVTRADFGAPYCMVKLDVGGTFRAHRSDLTRTRGAGCMSPASNTPSALLSPEERERFALWLEMDARTDELLLEQMAKLPGMAGELIAMRESDARAKRRIAQLLRAKLP